MADILEILGRSCADVCSHQISNGQKCAVCNVILYDHDDYIKEATFADLLIASPRKKTPLSDEILQGRIERLNQISRGLTDDTRAPIIHQKEYIAANLAKSQAVRSRIVAFNSKARQARDTLFPKLEAVHQRQAEWAPNQFDHSSGIISLARSDSPTRLRVRILLPPYGSEASILVIDVDDSVTGRDVISRIVHDEDSALDKTRNYVLRWVEDEDEFMPDLDLPPIDPDQSLTSINTNVLCLCDIDYDSDANESVSSF